MKRAIGLHQLRIGDRVKLKDSSLELRGDVWQLRSGEYVVVRWEDDYRSTHAASAIELDIANEARDATR